MITIKEQIFAALADGPMTLAELTAVIDRPANRIGDNLFILKRRGDITGELACVIKGRKILRYALAPVQPVVKISPSMERLAALLSDEPKPEADLARAAGMDQTSIRRLLETLRPYGLAVPTLIDGRRRKRAWQRPPVCLLGQWITGELFRKAA